MTEKPRLPENWRSTPAWKGFVPPKTATVRIVCAANRDRETGLIIAGPRHCDSTMRAQARAANKDLNNMEQGFIDQWGRYWNRRQAMQICEIEGQPVNYARQGGHTDILFSEGLY